MSDKFVFEQKEGKMTVGNSLFSLNVEGVEKVETGYNDNLKLSEQYFFAKATVNGVVQEYNVWEDISAIEMPMYEGVFEYPISGNNYTLRVVNFFAVTDYHDTFTNEAVYYMFANKIPKHTGNIFFLDEPLKKETYVFVSTAPDCAKASIEVVDGTVKLDACGYGLVVGKCKTSDSEVLVRAWYRKKCKPTELYTMANTWGDGNVYNRVSDDFIKKEIDAASELGIDTLQIDDGWQTGNTDDPAIRDEKRRRIFTGNFWELRKERFRNGMEEMRDYAAEKGVQLGLWFAPDSQHCYERLERDISVLENAYKNWGMRYFKFDMLYVENMEMYKKFREMLQRVYSFGEKVFVQLDVTNGVRCGYLGVSQYGKIFAENRYTKSGNSYPHRAMQNLWNICKYIPAYKFQFELVNPTLNTDKYAEDDLLAPKNYDMDYLFAVTMMSNPLFWMEVQFLPEKQREELKRIMPVWKAIRKELADADVVPVGERPDGASFTGFTAYTADGSKAYLLAFREVNEETNYTYSINKNIKNAKLLASNSDVSFNTNGNEINVGFGKMRTYALIELEL